ncbi:hypothetical protein RDI58_008190 [Solanum bulbocastanum]|uniref:Uncharacterized protein n=1 Tax=Solanum bulbocastanum TaxID=147425 RepID=A0AAN8U2T6_SOLBU
MYLLFLIVLPEEESLAAKSKGAAKPLKVTNLLFNLLLCYCKRKDPFLLKVLDDDREVSRTLCVLKISGSHQLCFAAAHFDFIRKATLADGEFAK